MAQLLKALAVLTEDPSSVSRTHMVAHNHLQVLFPGIQSFPGKYKVHIHAGKIHTHKIVSLKIGEKRPKAKMNCSSQLHFSSRSNFGNQSCDWKARELIPLVFWQCLPLKHQDLRCLQHSCESQAWHHNALRHEYPQKIKIGDPLYRFTSECLVFMYVCVPSVCLVPNELQIVDSHYVGTGTQTQICWKNSQCS